MPKEYCFFVEPKEEEAVVGVNTFYKNVHKCQLRKCRGDDKPYCNASKFKKRGFGGSTKYLEGLAKGCPSYTTDPKLAEDLIGFYGDRVK